MLSSVCGEGMHESIAIAVEFHWRHAETSAQLDIECRRGLQPPALDVEATVAVVDEQVGAAHQRAQRLGLQVISDVGEAEQCRDTRRPAHCGQEHRLRDAVSAPGLEDEARSIVGRIVRHGVWVVPDSVADGGEEASGLVTVAARIPDCRGGERPHGFVLDVEEVRCSQVRVWWLRSMCPGRAVCHGHR